VIKETGQRAEAEKAENRWPVIVAVLVVSGLYAALPESLSLGHRWVQGTVICGLLIPTIVTHHRGQHHLNTILGHILAATMTVFMIWSMVLLIFALPAHTETPVTLLRSAAALWVTNVLVFALWYWRLDSGGPYSRLLRGSHETGAFLFPQMTLPRDAGRPKWSPMFIDYVFLAFNTSTAFSPTDAPVLSRWAKALTMTQASISLCVVAILAARAINIL
jgi:hypothetical protein